MSIIAAARQALPHLNDYTDQEIMDVMAKIDGVKPGSAAYKKLESEALGYDRSVGDAVKDTGVALLQNSLGLAKSAVTLGAAVVPGVDTYGNAATKWLGAGSDAVGLVHKSRGLKNREAGSERAADIARRTAEAGGAGAIGQIGAEISGKAGAYSGQQAVQDALTSAGSFVGPALVGRGLQAGAAALGLGTKAALRAGVVGGVGSAAAMQGADVGTETYNRMIQAGADPETARVAANSAAAKAGAATIATSLLPGGSTIERSLLSGATMGRAGMNGVARRGLAGVAEAGTEAIEEGYGQYAGNQEMNQFDGKSSLTAGVGSAAVQGAVAAGPMGAVASHGRTQPRTVTGEIDLTGTPVGPTPLDAPTWARRGLDPLNERSSQYPNPAQQAAQLQAQQTGPGTIMVDSNGVALPPQSPEQMARLDAMRRFTDGIPTLTDQLAGPDGVPVLNDQVPAAPTLADVANPVFQPKPGEPAQYADLMNPTPKPVVDPYTEMDQIAAEAARGKAKPLNRGQLLSALAAANTALDKAALTKDGKLPNTRAAAPLRDVMESKDPLAAMRALHSDGAAARDELIDTWHKNLTGKTVFEWKAEQQATNSAGFVAEPAAQVQAQVDAVAEGRKDAAVLGEQEAAAADLKGLESAVATGPEGDTAVVVAAEPAKVKKAVARAKKVGLKQAMGEALGVANPTLTTEVSPDAAVVQQVDDKTGQVIGEELATPADATKVKQIAGTTTRVVTPEQVVAERKQAEFVSAVDLQTKNGDRYEVTSTMSGNKFTGTLAARGRGKHNAVLTFKDDEGRAHVERAQNILMRRAEVATPAPEAAPAPAAPAAPKKAPRYGKKTTEALIEISDNTKDEVEYNAARYEMYKRWAGDTDGGVSDAYLNDKKGASALTKAERKEFEAQYQAELEAKGIKAGQKLGAKFGAKLREGGGQAAGVPVHVARSIANSMVKGWKNAPQIEVVENVDALPEELRAEGEGRQVQALYLDGKVWIVASNHSSAADVVVSILHEVTGHHGLAGLLGDKLKSTMMAIYNGNPEIRKAADTMAAAEGLAVEIAVEEVLADATEQGRIAPTVVERIGNVVRQMLRAIGLGRFADGVSNGEVKALIANARAFVEGGAPASAPVAEPKARDRAGPVERAGARTAAAIEAEVKAQVKGQEISTKLLSTMMLRQIAEQYGAKLPALNAWIDAIMERGAKASALASRADRVAVGWEQDVRDPAERKALADIFLRASDSEVELDNHTADYLADLSAKQLAEHTSLNKKLATLSPQAQRVRKQVLEIMQAQWKYTRASLESFINHTVADPQLRNQRIEDLKHEMGRNRGDYFPFTRFGDRIVIAAGAASDGRDVVSFHETEAAANKAVVDHKKAGVKNVTVTLKTDFDKSARTSTGFVGNMHQMIDNSEADSSAKQELHEALQQLFLRSMPELSGAKAMIRRENVEGYSRDALRVFADSVTRSARYASHLEFGPVMRAAQEAAEQQSRSSDKRLAAVVIGRKDGSKPKVAIVEAGTDRLNAVNSMEADGFVTEFFNAQPETVEEHLVAKLQGATADEIKAHVAKMAEVVGRTGAGIEDMRAAKALYNHMIALQNSRTEPNKLVDALGQLGHAWFLGFSPSAWAMNLLQNPQVGLPHLGAKYGIARSTGEWLNTAKWFSGVRMGKLFTDKAAQFSVEWLKQEATAGRLKGINKQELDMLQEMQDRQILDFTQSMDLARIGQASSSPKYKFLRLAAAGAHHTEVFNRVTFALAAYRLAMKSNTAMTHAEAVRRTEHDVVATHYDYSPANSPLVMKGNLAKSIFMFQKYRQHQLYWWASNIKEAIKGEAPADRARARKAAFLMGTTQLVFGGARALPFIGSIAFLANLFAGADDDGVPFDFNAWISSAAKDAMGDAAGEAFSQGIFGLVGMNIAQRIGQGGLLLNAGSEKYERNADDKVRAYLFDLVGPLGSVAQGVARATDAFSRGDVVGGFAATTPKVISDALKAYQLHESGLLDKKGLTIAPAESFDATDVLMQSLGVVPRKLADLKADGAKIKNIDQGLKDRTSQLTSRFVEAWAREDRDGMVESVASIKEFNEKVGAKYQDKSLLIDGRQLEMAVKDYQSRAIRLAVTSGSAATQRQMLIASKTPDLNTPVTRETIQQNAGGLRGLPGLPGLGR